jgi:5-oxoprolinase (ATP-hydrolysing) subunit A
VVVAVDGTAIPTEAASLCLHGDSPDAVDTARRVARALRDAGVTLAPFA